MLLRLVLLSLFIISLLANCSVASQSGRAGSRSQRAEGDQSTETQQQVNNNDVVPRFVKFSGVLKDGDGKPYTGIVGVRFSLFASEESVSPLWSESQTVTADATGHYNVL